MARGSASPCVALAMGVMWSRGFVFSGGWISWLFVVYCESQEAFWAKISICILCLVLSLSC